jgi:hypothetical protein
MNQICPFCNKKMGFLCKCGAYKVYPDTYHLPLHKQPYYREGMEKKVKGVKCKKAKKKQSSVSTKTK